MTAKIITETISLWEVDAYFERHNLVIRPESFEWLRDKKTGLETPHVWTEKKQNERNPDEEKITEQ